MTHPRSKIILLAEILVLILTSSHCENNLSGRIVSGVNALEGEFPFMVEISVKKRGVYCHTCGGSYIHSDWVLTAAHCIVAYAENTDYRLTIGSIKYRPDNPRRHQRFGTTRIAHAKYCEKPVPTNDVGLIKIDKPFGTKKNIAIIPSSFDYAVDKPVYALGFGGEKICDTKSQITIPAILQKLKSKINRPRDNYDPNAFFIGRYMSNVCFGDSGGPVVHDGNVIGIISSMQRAPGGNCLAKFARIVKVVHYQDWIRTKISIAGRQEHANLAWICAFIASLPLCQPTLYFILRYT